MKLDAVVLGIIVAVITCFVGGVIKCLYHLVTLS